MLALASVAGIRYLTFDPIAWTDGVNEEVSPVPMLMRRVPSAVPHGESGTPPGKPDLADAEIEAWKARALVRGKAMQARFHSGAVACVRYGTPDAPSPALVAEAADAIVNAGLAPQVRELVTDVARWRAEADDRVHAADLPTEVLTYFGENASVWQRLGLWMHRGAALAALRQHAATPQAQSEHHVRPESSAAARQIGERYGSVLVPAAMSVHAELRGVDLRAPQIAFLSPGMPERELEGRLGPPEGRTVDTWTWKDPAVEVLFDERHEVLAVSRAIHGADGALGAGGIMLANRDEPTLREVLGAPAWTHDDGEHRELVWEAGPFRRRILLERGNVARVELWKKDRLAPPK